jgi:hypothetical protein
MFSQITNWEKLSFDPVKRESLHHAISEQRYSDRSVHKATA